METVLCIVKNGLKVRLKIEPMIIFIISTVIVFLTVLIIYPMLVINSRITRKEEQKEDENLHEYYRRY